MNFRVGQKVVCIAEAWLSVFETGEPLIKDPSSVFPVLHGVYTITTIENGCLRLREPMKYLHYTDLGFDAGYFRPLVTRESDISIFTRLLAPNAKILELT